MKQHMKQGFKALFGADPYTFQLTTAQTLLDGRNAILQAPTGAGKTRSALFPFLHAKQHQLCFADRLIYALPQRTLAVALYEQTKEQLKHVLQGAAITIQTGAMPQDSFFEADIVFTTIDQVLSAYIGVPVSLPRKRANLPAGAILGAYVVFDEFHLLEPGRALATTLDLADRLCRYTRLLLMSATVPEQSLEEVARRTHAAVVRVTADELQAIPSQRNKTRRFVRRHESVTAQAILDAHKGRSIAVVNRVERAQELFEDVKRMARERGLADRLLLLHSRFLMEDRQKIEAAIVERFRRGGSGGAILIATQVIEVGLDISVDVLHTELAPANSIFQRAGRCARYEAESGTVYVYDLPLKDDGKPIYGPYLKEQQSLVDETGRLLGQHSGQSIGLEEEKAVVDAVHTESDRALLRAVGPQTRSIEVAKAMRTGEAHYVRQLIRDVDSVNIIVHDQPNTLRMDRRPQSFSVDRSVIRAFLAKLDLEGKDAGCAWIPKFDEHEQGETLEEVWRPVARTVEANDAVFLAIAPTHAHYDSELGLQLGHREAVSLFRSQETLNRSDAGFDPYSYVKETYEAHVKLVIARHDAQATSCRVATARLAQTFGLGADALEDLSRLVAALHDVGKLADKWQEAVWRWQKEIHYEERDGFLAHTEFDGTNAYQRQMQKKSCFKKPPHAVEGAYAALPILAGRVQGAGVSDEHLESVTCALTSAIARHHSAFSENLSDFALSPAACTEALRVAGIAPAGQSLWPRPLPALPSAKLQVERVLVTPQEHGDAFLLYWHVARRLRLADQQATSMAGGGS